MNDAERMAQIMYETPLDPEDNPSPWPPSHPEDLRWWMSRGEALVQSGFGDVSAERERADRYRKQVESAEEQTRGLYRENRALQARIDAAPHDPRHCDLIHYPDRRRKGTVTCTCWKSEDQPPATPDPLHLDRQAVVAETINEFEDLYFGPGVQTRTWVANTMRKRHGLPPRPTATPEPKLTESPALPLGQAMRQATPEPPHLDPLPMVATGRRSSVSAAIRDAWAGPFLFAPREHDENGKPYSRKREDYL